MRQLSAFREAGRVRGVFCDIDDTLTTDGRLTALAYAAMERLRAAGKLVVPITGRPAGWCDHIARLWPVDAVVGENGGFYFCYDAAARRLVRRFPDDEPTRAANRARLKAVRDRILREVPGSAVACDQPFRETGLAIDVCEEVPRLSEAAIGRIVAIMEASGLTATLGSTRVNGRFGHTDALGMTRTLMQEQFGVDLDQPGARADYAFVGASPGDAAMFAFFPHSVGVANVRDFLERMPDQPKYITSARCGAGFAELAEMIIREGASNP
jgi:hypothetical protein